MSKQIITNSTKKILNNNNIQVEEIIKNIIYILSPKYNFDETEAYHYINEKPKRKNTGFEKEKLFVDNFNTNQEYKNNLFYLNLQIIYPLNISFSF